MIKDAQNKISKNHNISHIIFTAANNVFCLDKCGGGEGRVCARTAQKKGYRPKSDKQSKIKRHFSQAFVLVLIFLIL